MNPAFSFCATVFIYEVLKSAGPLAAISEPDLILNFFGGMHVSQRGKSNIVKWVIWNIVLSQVRKAILETPKCKRIELIV